MDDDSEFLANAECYADSARGIYIPQHFAESIKRDCVKGVSEENFAILAAGPEHEHYWEAWDETLSNAELTDNAGRRWFLYQDGDLWMVPKESGE